MRSLRNVMHTVCVMQASPVMHAVTRVCGTHRITYHSEAATLITYLQNKLIRGIILKKRGVYYVRIKASGALYGLLR